NAPMYTYFLLGRAYHLKSQFDDAIESYGRYLSELDQRDIEEINYVDAHIYACEQAKRMIGDPVDVVYRPFGGNIQMEGNIKNPVISGGRYILIFLYERNNVTQIMDARKVGDSWSEPKEIEPQSGMTGSVFPVSLSYDGSELYLVYDDDSDKDIYVSHYIDNRWSKMIKLNRHINSRFDETHASISKDGQTLIFTSDRRRGMGGLDIYYANRINGDKWDKAVNMGYPINTVYDEGTPFATDDGNQLYFSSQGHNTMGGYDIFLCNRTPDGSWEAPYNIGYPLNTTGDDLFFNPDWGTGPPLYATSNNSTDGYMSLYSVQIYAREQVTSVNAMPAFRPEQIKRRAAPSPETTPDELALSAKQDGDKEMSEEEFPTSFELSSIKNSILFDFNESGINKQSGQELDRIYELLEKYPDINIELTGRTDSRGNPDYNLQLSIKRAQSAAEYLVSKGIDSERITVKAVGDSEPVASNQNEDGSDAPEGRKLNRSISIILSNPDDEMIRIADVSVPDELNNKADMEYTILMFQSTGRVTSTPKVLLDEQVSMLATDETYSYTLGKFPTKDDASVYLNEVIGKGYPDAQIVSLKNLNHLLQGHTLANHQTNPDCFTIQFLEMIYPRDALTFSNLSNVKGYKCKDGLYRFVTGEYSGYEDARQHLAEVMQQGYTDAIVMPCSYFSNMMVQDQMDK
ncbi:MAG: OmpA family protein, partial [Bacteroidales bacterium]|nr:OmpA family protein [Bacteroidales bacterium]